MSVADAATIHHSPEEAVAAYFAGVDSASSRIIRSAFHPAAPLQWVDPDGTPRALQQAVWWGRVDASGTPASTRAQKLLDREGGLAMVEATSEWATHAFDDLLILADTPDGWRITGKVFARRPPGTAPGGGTAEDERAIREVLETKIEAHAAWDPALLVASHLPDCIYFARRTPGTAFGHRCLSEGAAEYARRHDRGEEDRESKWRILSVVQRGAIAAAKLDVIYLGTRYIDHLLLLRTAEGWRIAAAQWGDPAAP